MNKKVTEILNNLRYNLPQLLPAALVIVVYIIAADLIFGAACPFVIVTGLPCPACGMTRATLCFLTGQWAAGIQYNALALVWAPLLAVMFFRRVCLNKDFDGWEKILIPVCLITIGYYIYRLIAVYPGPEPMCRHERCILNMLRDLLLR